MGLSFGWKKGEEWVSYWPEDDAFGPIPLDVREEFDKDGEGSRLLKYVKNGKDPTAITFRTLTSDETRKVIVCVHEAGSPLAGLIDAYHLCFRMGVDFPSQAERWTVREAGGAEVMCTKHTNVRGVRMLSEKFVDYLDVKYPGMVSFYGAKVYAASFPSEAEKKVLSQPSMPSQSAESTDHSGSAA